MKIVCSFSGGRTSAYMAHLLLQKHERQDLLFVFANTGKENPETLDFVNECDTRWKLNTVWLEAVIHPDMGQGTSYKIVSYETASRKGEPFSAMNDKYGIPNQHFPHCTRELKEVPIRKYVLAVCGRDYQMAIGIRADERSRVNKKRAEKEQWFYPLAFEHYVTKQDVRDFWKTQPFDLQLEDYQGNCDLCWKKSQNKRLKILHEHPHKGDWWQLEESLDVYPFDRDGLSIGDLRKKAALMASQLSIGDLNDERACHCFSNLNHD